ncbi:hypothetical protein [Alcanivorax sp. 1008]|uniref:hypothetical protein n=1 Tax=Alcanivorax sp. 1008 TaxID=2816853 RepID=UPI001D4CF6A9|nr:hypothetical protein [Alcanivorax sp. 1008]MCC1497514.1 hypothetical protein [Alcanivorax sp. 1008]
MQLNKFVTLLSVLLFSGCTHQALMESDLNSELGSARSNAQYAKALSIIRKTPDEHPQYQLIQQQREAVLNEITLHLQGRIAEADRLTRSGRWQEAFSLISDLDKQWRGNEDITAARQTLEHRRHQRLQQLRADLLSSEADWLLAHRSSINQLETLANRQADNLASQIQHRQSDLADEMSQLGYFFAEQNDWRRTQVLLGGARKLRDSEEYDPLLTEAERQLAGAAHRREQAASARTQQRANALIEAYRKSDSINDLVTARDYLQKNNEDGSLDEIASDLESLCRERFDQGVRKGDRLYAAGNYPEAEKTWQEVLPLYPGDGDLSGKIQRVQRVLSNLQNLKR